MSDTTTPGKTCTRCGEWKPLSEFSVKRSRCDGHRNECKACCRAMSLAYRATRREEDAEYRRLHRKENPEMRAEHQRRQREKRREARRLYLAEHPDEALAKKARAQQARRENHATELQCGIEKRTLLLAYLREHLADGTLPATKSAIGAALGMDADRVRYHLRRLWALGQIEFNGATMNLAELRIPDAPLPSLGRRCGRCEILSEYLDRAGYCPACQFELAYGRPFFYWNENGIRLRVRGMLEPQEEPEPEILGTLPVANWPTAGRMVEIRV